MESSLIDYDSASNWEDGSDLAVRLPGFGFEQHITIGYNFPGGNRVHMITERLTTSRVNELLQRATALLRGRVL